MRILFLLIVIVPIVEMYILINVGSVIGALPTIGLVVLTAVLGAALIRLQGLVVLYNLQRKLAHGELPAEELLTGVALLVAGALLLTPGFVTDSMGFLLLLPAFRRWLFRKLMEAGAFRVYTQSRQGPVTLEGEFSDADRDRRGR